MPSTYRDGDIAAPLPPTYQHQGYENPIIAIRSSYHLQVSITRIRYQKLDLWPKCKLYVAICYRLHTMSQNPLRIVIPFSYHPRTRSHRPIPSFPCFLSSVKTSPEEWYQTVTTLKTRLNSTDDPLACHVSHSCPFFLSAKRLIVLSSSSSLLEGFTACATQFRSISSFLAAFACFRKPLIHPKLSGGCSPPIRHAPSLTNKQLTGTSLPSAFASCDNIPSSFGAKSPPETWS